MKHAFGLLVIAAAFACNNPSTVATNTDSTKVEQSAAAPLEYAYAIEKPDNWERGDPALAQMVLSSLKAYENGNIDECVKHFGDSITLHFDYYEAKLSNDSLKASFKKNRSSMKSMEVKMDDWESVISKDKKEQWVSLWYKEKWTDDKGKTDSVAVMDDVKIENGKIVLLDEKTRHYPKK